MWLVKAPFRWLIMARDAYIRSITSWSGAGIFSGSGSSGFGQFSGNFHMCDPPSTALPRSFTLTSTARDKDGLMSRGGRSPMDRRRNYICAVELGRIDEEISREEEEEESFLDYGRCKVFQKLMKDYDVDPKKDHLKD
ncbi:hypothetical protein AALP_AA5G120600 [Arabis alpina]|uniref:Uncharacterized protein n=1 Tax=Arabis alpina TaxID=50452 RepID=A0A087GWJ8_ARAAL|nr:hypothetical protein AALP_AA5G120600 [Arabis alpina]